jgi:hypothetical protein
MTLSSAHWVLSIGAALSDPSGSPDQIMDGLKMEPRHARQLLG